MMNPAHVLLIGNDPAQLHVQANVLKHFWTIATASPTCLEALLPTTHVAVLSHSLSETERQAVVTELNRTFPNLLLVKINGYDSGPHAGVDASVDLHHGPGALVSTIYGLLTEQGLPSRGWAGTDLEPVGGVH